MRFDKGEKKKNHIVRIGIKENENSKKQKNRN